MLLTRVSRDHRAPAVHIINFIFFISLVLMIGLIAGCQKRKAPLPEMAPVTAIDISVYFGTPDLTEYWNQIEDTNPLPAPPQGYIWDLKLITDGKSPEKTAAEEATAFAINIDRRDWGQSPGQTDTGQSKTIFKRYYTPLVHFTDPVWNISLKEVQGGSFNIQPMEEVHLPMRGTAVEGLYPGEPGYPLLEEIIIRYQSDGGVDALAARTIRDWLESIPEDQNTPQIAWVSGVGDIMPGRGVDHILLRGDPGIEEIFSDTLPILRGADILVGNLEGAVTKTSERAEKTYTFRFKPELLAQLKSAGFDYLSLTNNHSFDYGVDGFKDTLAYLEEYGIATSGAGNGPAEAGKTWQSSAGDQHIEILSFGAYPIERSGFDGAVTAAVGKEKPGILWADQDTMDSLKKIFSEDLFSIALIHGGEEWQSTPTEAQKQLYRLAADSGADLVLGSHPHYLQGIEIYKGCLIAYSLGNFIFPGMDETEFGEESMVLSVGIYNDEIRYVRYTPVRIDNLSIGIDESGTILDRFLTLSRDLAE